MAKRRFELQIEKSAIGPGGRRRVVTKMIHATPRQAAQAAVQAVRTGRGSVDAAVIRDNQGVTVVRCHYSIRARKPTRRVERSWARCNIDPRFKKQMKGGR